MPIISSFPSANKDCVSSVNSKLPGTDGQITITATDVGADVSGSSAAVQTGLNTHTSNRANPHGVTAAQVGARASTWTPTAADVGALPLAGGTITGNLTLKGTGNYGNKINFGDGDLVHLYEVSDDKLQIKASNLDFVVGGKITKNGSKTLATIEDDINPLKTSVSNGKSQIASAITDKGISTSSTAEFSTMANNIRSIQTGPNGLYMHWAIFNGSRERTVLYIDDGETGRPTTVSLVAVKPPNINSYRGLLYACWIRVSTVGGTHWYESGTGAMRIGANITPFSCDVALYDSPRRFEFDSELLEVQRYILAWSYM